MAKVAPAPMRTNSAAQFDVDWRDFIQQSTKPTGQVNYPAEKPGTTRTMQSGPVSGEDIFSDRRKEGRRSHGR